MCIPQICPNCGDPWSEHAFDCVASGEVPPGQFKLDLEGFIPAPPSPNAAAIALLKKRADELRGEAAGISLIEHRERRRFAAGVLDQIIEELS